MNAPGTLYSLQLLRFIAALLVLLFHLELYQSGYKGVDIFFVISGYVMYYTSYIQKPKSAGSFLINRLTKIFLLYWMALFLLFIFTPFTINPAFLNTIFLIPGHTSILGVSWSLSYELYFYLLFGTAFYLLPKRYGTFLFVFLLISSTGIAIINTTSLSIKGSTWNFLAGQNLWEFLLGISGACIAYRLRPSLKPLMLISALLLSSILFAAINISYANPKSYLIYGTLSFLMILTFTRLENQIPFGGTPAKWMALAGDASYAIYLFGPLITKAVLPETLDTKILVIGITVIVSVMINTILEKPILRFCRDRLHGLLQPGDG